MNSVADELPAALSLNRRHFMGRAGLSFGALAMSRLLADEQWAGAAALGSHYPPKVKRVIYLFQSGAPSQIELFDYKPALSKHHSKDLPDSIRMGQRLTTMTSGQKTFPVAQSIFKFAQHGSQGIWLSELIPHTAHLADQLCFVRSMKTDAINHDPAVTFCQTGSELAGRPSLGAWVAYGLGSMNQDLPSFAVFVSRGTGRPGDQPLYDRLWGSGFLPTKYQGVKFRSGKEPVLYLANSDGVTRRLRRQMLDDVVALNTAKYQNVGDPTILTRIEQYELAFRMQMSVPELTDISSEPQSVLDLYGPDVHKPGTYARHCLLARRLAERDVRFIQLYHMGWDQHFHLPTQIRKQCGDTDQPSAALVKDLMQRGLLNDTLIIWGGEFGRTVYSQGELAATDYGRDHHPRCFSIWMTGGGLKRGVVHGATDDFSYNITENPVEVFDLNATILHLLGIDHKQLTYKHQGRDYRLTDVHGHVVHDLLV